MVQEMGIRDRIRSNDEANPTDKFHIYLDLNEFIYLNKRLYKKGEPEASGDPIVASIIDVKTQRNMQR